MINGIFGFSVEHVWPGCGEFDDDYQLDESSDPCELTAAAGATEFADGPSTLWYANDTTALVTSSLPSGSTIVYEATIGEEDEAGELGLEAAAVIDAAGVAAMPFGDGVVVFLGWDWYPDESGTYDENEAQWAIVLDLAVSQPAVTASGDAGSLTFTSDSPSTQPVFVSYAVGDVTDVATIAPGTTSVTVELDGPARVTWSVPGWGIGSGTTEVAAAVVTPTPGPTPAPTPAQPVVAQPSFTG